MLSGYVGEYVIVDKGYDARWLRECIGELGIMAVILGRSNRKVVILHDPDLYGERHLVGCFIGKVKCYCRSSVHQV